MGKRFSISYANNFFPSIIGATPSGSFGLNYTHCLNLDYVIRKRTVLCVSAQHFNTGMYFNRTIYSNTFDGFGYQQEVQYDYDPVVRYQPMQVSVNTVGLGFKFFSNGTLAPVGKYKKLELLVMRGNVFYGQKAFTFYNDVTSEVERASIGKGEYTYNSFALAYTIGAQRILANCIVLDYGIQFAVTPNVIAGALADDGNYVYATNESEIRNAFKYDYNNRLFRHQAINLHIGIGFLAF